MAINAPLWATPVAAGDPGAAPTAYSYPEVPMSWTTISDAATVQYPQFEMTGPLLYDTASGLLIHLDEATGDEEVLSACTGSSVPLERPTSRIGVSTRASPAL